VVLGPRFLIEAGFIVAVAVVAGVADLSTWAIIGAVAAAWILVALVEMAVWARHASRRKTVGPTPAAEPPVLAERKPMDVVPQSREAPPAPKIAAAPPPPEPEPAPEEPEPETTPGPEPEVAYLPAAEAPREWNLWELERVARDNATDDVAKNEERAYLLMYLREFAGPDGMLPADFDGLVRDAFGDLLRVVAL
jgi:type IV secretory pathway VirB10-like protein